MMALTVVGGWICCVAVLGAGWDYYMGVVWGFAFRAREWVGLVTGVMVGLGIT
jgi:hypothetical protein